MTLWSIVLLLIASALSIIFRLDIDIHRFDPFLGFLRLSRGFKRPLGAPRNPKLDKRFMHWILQFFRTKRLFLMTLT
jgi:hypothetical protein